jgi:hypothetical protein
MTILHRVLMYVPELNRRCHPELRMTKAVTHVV